MGVGTGTADGGLEAFRTRVRAWCEEHVPEGWPARMATAGREEYVAFQRWWLAELRAGGFAAPHWPREWGGAGFSLPELVVVYEELARADAPRLGLYFVSLHHAPATLLGAGTPEQQRRHLPAILDGEVWCQGFSEPDAGSDLASLTTRAERHGDDFVVNGQKIWSSLADHADYCLLLARTDPTAPKRRGISYLILDMRSPGIEVRPITTCVGGAEFCEIFLTDVVIPAENLIGPEHDGWRVAQTTLSAERSVTIVELAERLRSSLARLLELASVRPGVTSPTASRDPVLRQALARSYAEVEILRLLCSRMVENLVRHGGPGPEASIVKLVYSETLQRLTGLGARIEGSRSQLVEDGPAGDGSGHWLRDHLGSWSWTIAGGTNEIQRTLVGERVLGLPRESAGGETPRHVAAERRR